MKPMPVEETSALCMKKNTQQSCLATAAAAEAAAQLHADRTTHPSIVLVARLHEVCGLRTDA